MEFGRASDLTKSDLTLPADHPLTSKVLKTAKRKSAPRIYVGCPVWAESKMLGTFYPRGTKAKDYLAYYARQFNSIELNASGYGVPADEEISGWTKDVTKGFVFCPKVPLQIARTNPLAKNAAAVASFYHALDLFGTHMGSALLQLHPSFGPSKFDQLLEFFRSWDSSYSLHLELRHPDWFNSEATFDDLTKAMSKNKIGFAITDVTGRRDVVHQCLTTPSAFIRFDAHDLDPTDFARLDDWADRIETWVGQGLRTLYFFVHTPQKQLNPELANYFVGKLKERGIS